VREWSFDTSLSFPVARINILDVDLTVVFVDAAMPDKLKLYAALHRSVTNLGPGENLVLVWPDEFGRTRFIAPPEQHPFLQVVGYDQLSAQINSKLELAGIADPLPPARG
jgi:hypothetical protein